MLFLIDYENVGNMGMKGCDYLNASDHMIVFYSEAQMHMERRFLDGITKSECVFEVCKLYKSGKNALDFLYRLQAWRNVWQRLRGNSGDRQSR